MTVKWDRGPRRRRLRRTNRCSYIIIFFLLVFQFLKCIFDETSSWRSKLKWIHTHNCHAQAQCMAAVWVCVHDTADDISPNRYPSFVFHFGHQQVINDTYHECVHVQWRAVRYSAIQRTSITYSRCRAHIYMPRLTHTRDHLNKL